jgi:xanthine/CO dehydrogenase XdhC/CoxF family maturation factor
MLICEDGAIVGSLSAGCLDEEVALHGRKFADRPVAIVDVRYATAIRLPVIDIFIERV